MRIRRITTPDDPLIEPAIALYEKLFPNNGRNYTGAELRQLARRQHTWSLTRHVVTEHIILIAETTSRDAPALPAQPVPPAPPAAHVRLAGFVMCHYYPERRKALISYLGIDRDTPALSREAAPLMLTHLRDFLHEHRDCEYLFFETLKPEPALGAPENRTRRARIRLLKQLAARIGPRAIELGFDYESPRIALTQHAAEHALALIAIPLRAACHHRDERFTRDQVTAFLRFIYNDTYGEIYETHDTRFRLFQTYLQNRVQRAAAQLPEWVCAV